MGKEDVDAVVRDHIDNVQRDIDLAQARGRVTDAAFIGFIIGMFAGAGLALAIWVTR